LHGNNYLKTIILMSSTIGKKVYYPENWEQDGQLEIRGHLYNKRAYLLAKRVVDIFFSSTLIILLFPWLFPMIALLIKVSSKGPVLFKQKRVGFLGKTFWCYKFRTMYVNDQADEKQATKDDPRITRVGKFLRHTCLDELPQFLNVFLGHMSIVGPRPHMLKDSRDFSAAVMGYKFRNMAKPGITGISQVRGYRGPATTFQSVFRRYQWDAYYIRNMSFRLDIKVITATALLILRSVFDRERPVPLDSHIIHGQNKNQIKKIA
jgi:putative colanic acid biosynthesis UDP-glucose lipid carrier transferase